MTLFRTDWTRRQLLKQSGMIGAAATFSPLAAGTSPLTAAESESGAQTSSLTRQGTDTDNLYTKIGVRPILNARGTFTIISGSRSLPQVKQAMFEASHYFVQLDEMMDGMRAQVGKRAGA